MGEWGFTERANTFARASVIRDLADPLPAGAPTSVLDGFADGFLEDRRVTLLAPLAGSAYERVERHTTRGLLELEQATPTLEREPAERALGCSPRLSYDPRKRIALLTRKTRARAPRGIDHAGWAAGWACRRGCWHGEGHAAR